MPRNPEREQLTDPDTWPVGISAEVRGKADKDIKALDELEVVLTEIYTDDKLSAAFKLGMTLGTVRAAERRSHFRDSHG